MTGKATDTDRIRGRSRGQTTLDFGVGASVFLLTVLFAVVYAPTLFDPFAGGTGTTLLVADRAATSLSADYLATSTAAPGTLSATCVGTFFEADLADTVQGASCDASGDLEAFDDLLSLDGRSASVTIHALDSPASQPVAETDETWIEDGQLTRSNDESVPSDVGVATRTVSIEGQQYRLTVRVW